MSIAECRVRFPGWEEPKIARSLTNRLRTEYPEAVKSFTIIRHAACVLALACAHTAWAAAEGFERYQVILERQIFGEPPPPPEEPEVVPEEKPPWADQYRLCSVYEEEGKQIQVALLDLKTQKAVMLTLGGEPDQGIELLSADVVEEEATLQKDGKSFTMKLTASNRPKTPPNPQAPTAAAAAVRANAAARAVIRPGQPAPAAPMPGQVRPRGVVRPSGTR